MATCLKPNLGSPLDGSQEFSSKTHYVGLVSHCSVFILAFSLEVIARSLFKLQGACSLFSCLEYLEWRPSLAPGVPESHTHFRHELIWSFRTLGKTVTVLFDTELWHNVTTLGHKQVSVASRPDLRAHPPATKSHASCSRCYRTLPRSPFLPTQPQLLYLLAAQSSHLTQKTQGSCFRQCSVGDSFLELQEGSDWAEYHPNHMYICLVYLQ